MLQVDFQEDVWDNEELPAVLRLKEDLIEHRVRKLSVKVGISFKRTTWCEPTTVLALANVLQDFQQHISSIEIVFGKIDEIYRG